MQTLGIWLGAFFTLATYSFLYGDNPTFRFAEHVFIGLATAHAAVMGYTTVVTRAWAPFMRGQIVWIGAILGGALLLLRLFKGTMWVSRIPLGFMVGITAALSIVRGLDAELWRQLIATMLLKWNTVNSVLYIIFVLTTLSYFVFCYNERSLYGRGLGYARTVGQYVMMVTFGASLGATVMARISLVIGRLTFLLKDWLGVLQ